MSLEQKGSILSLIVFAITLVILIISLIPVIFPALLLHEFGGVENHLGINPFDLGIWAYPVLITDAIVFGLAILYFKGKLPDKITRAIKFIFNFEVSAEVACLVIVVLLGIYIAFTIGELFNGQFDPDYYTRVKSYIDNYNILDFSDHGIGTHLQYLLEFISLKVFNNYKIIPYLASISLLIVTYYVTKQLSKKRFAGIVSLVLVLQSGVFLFYDTAVSYPNFWILFYILSLYFVSKKWFLSPVSYVASIISKELTLAFILMNIFFVHRANLTKRKKIILVASFLIIFVISGSVLFFVKIQVTPDYYPKKFSTHDFIGGFSALSLSMRDDGMVVIFLLPLVVGLYILSRKGGIAHADSVMFLIFAFLLSGPFLIGVSDIINVPYRFIPLVVFFAMGVGLLLSRRNST